MHTQATVIPAHAGIHWVNAADRAPERATLQRVDTGIRRYDNGWLNHVTNQAPG